MAHSNHGVLRLYLGQKNLITDRRDRGMYTIYALADLKTHEVFYVGCTRNPKRRLQEHRATDCYRRKSLESRLATCDHGIEMLTLGKPWVKPKANALDWL
jgi:GIY-YIG catalytic domain